MSIYINTCHMISYPSCFNMKNMELPKQNTKYPMQNANCIYRTWYELNLPASTSNLAYCANTECIFALCNWWSCFSFYPNIARVRIKFFLISVSRFLEKSEKYPGAGIHFFPPARFPNATFIVFTRQNSKCALCRTCQNW